MKPVYLRLTGLNSFSETKEIDFERLSAAGLFVICGDTGSGKTTIVDAIMLALYGKVSRVQKGGYINLRGDACEVEFRFKIGGTGGERLYSAWRRETRKGMVRGTLKEITPEGEIVIADQPDKARKECALLIGLSRADFKQCVILEQGRFDEFLKQDASKRIEALGRIFRLEHLGAPVYILTQNRITGIAAKKTAAEETLAKYADVGEEDAAAAKTELESTLKEEKEVRAAAAALDKEEKELRSRAAKEEEAVKAAAELKTRQAEYAEILDFLSKSAGEESAERERLQKERKEKESALTALKIMSEKLKRAGEAEIKLTENRADYAACAAAAEGKKAEAAERQSVYNKAVSAAAEGRAAYSEKISRINAACGLSLPPMPEDCGDAAEILARFVSAAEKYIAAERQIAENGAALAEKQKSLAALQETHFKNMGEAAREETALKTLSAARGEAERALDNAAAENARAGLLAGKKAGDGCPVCGKEMERLPESEGADISAFKAAAEAARQAESAARERISRLKSAGAGLTERISSGETECARLTEAVKKAEGEAVKAAADFPALKTGAERLKEGAEKYAPNLAQQQKEIFKREKEGAEAKAAAEAAAAAVAAGQEKARLLDAAAAALAAELKAAGVSGGGAAAAAAQNLKEIAETESALTALSLQAEAAGAARADAEKRKAAAEGRIAQLKAAAEGAGGGYIKRLAAAESALAEAKERIEKTSAQRTALEIRVGSASARLAMKKQLISDIKMLEKSLAVHNSLLNLFKGKAFLGYIINERITRLARAAGELTSLLTDGNFSLDYVGGEFMVADRLNGGSRPAGTLSGGETFIASLALAHTLAREISRERNLGFFFLDEGFGTLDGACIANVLSALDKLRMSGLTIGVISHRSELTDEIPSRLTVVKAEGGTGSDIIQD